MNLINKLNQQRGDHARSLGQTQSTQIKQFKKLSLLESWIFKGQEKKSRSTHKTLISKPKLQSKSN